MKKTNKSAIVLLVLLVAVAVTALFVASTYAKYVGDVNGSGTATVAKWSFEDDNDDVDFEIDLTENYDPSTLSADRIAPGTSGSFDITLVNTNTETGVNFTLTLGTVTGQPKNLKFYKNSDFTGEIVPGTTEVTGQIAAKDSTGVNIPIYWKWAYESGSDDLDTADGEAAANLTVPVTISGVQTQPSTTAITSHVD